MNKITLRDISTHMETLAMDVAEGEADAMDVYAALQSIRKSADLMEKAVKDNAIEEAMKWGADKGPVERNGFVFRFQSGRSMYKYSHIKPWEEAQKRMKMLEELAKLGQKNGCEMPDPETGEVIAPAIVEYSKDSLSVKPI